MTNRITLLRNLMGLSRSELNKRYNIPRGTIQNWESGRYPLTMKGAQRLVNAAKAEGINITIDWLVNGIGEPPQSNEYMITSESSNSSIPNNIKNEMSYFTQNNSDAITFTLNDHAMEPHFEVGDIVAGNRFFGEDIARGHLKKCIVQTPSHEMCVRILKCTNIPNKYHLIALNHTIEDLVEEHYVDVISAAPVMWLRKGNINV